MNKKKKNWLHIWYVSVPIPTCDFAAPTVHSKEQMTWGG